MDEELRQEILNFLEHVAAYGRNFRAMADDPHSPILNYMSKDAVAKTSSHFYHLIEPSERLAAKLRATRSLKL